MKLTGIRGLFFISTGLAFVGFSACRKAGSSGPVVAQVGSEKITFSDLKERLQDAPPQYQQYMATADGRRQFLNLLVREKVLLREAANQNIQNQATYKESIAKFKAESARRMKEYETSLQIESALQTLRSKELSVTDSDVEKYYNDHLSDYKRPVEIMASHILVPTEAEAQDVLTRLKAGESFDKLAKALSKDPGTAVLGGKMRTPFHRGMLVPEFEDAAFALKVGQISQPVKTQFGFHIIKKLGEKLLPSKSLADVKEEIRAKLEREKFDQWVTAKQDKLGVKTNDQAMSQLSLEEPSKP